MQPLPTSRARRGPWLVALLLVGGLLAAACGSSGSSSTSTSTTAGGSSSSAPSGDPLAPQPLEKPYTIKMTPALLEVFSQPMLADMFGELEKENLSLEVTPTPTSEALALLNAGDTDTHVTSPVAGFFNAVNQGLNVRWAAASNQFRTGVADRPLPAARDVRERWHLRPGVAEGRQDRPRPSGWGDLAAGFFKDWLDDHGLSTDDIDIQQFNSVDAMSQLENGALDGAVLADPLYQQAIDRDFGKLFLSFPEGSTFNGYFVGPNLLEKNRAAGEAFFRAIARTTQKYLQGDYHDDPEVAQAIADAIKAPVANVTATEPLIFAPNLALDPSWADQVQKAWIDIGGVLAYDDPLATDRWVDTSLIAPLANVQ